MEETLITKYAYSYDQKDRNYLPYQDNTVTFLRGRAVLYSATWTRSFHLPHGFKSTGGQALLELSLCT